MTGMITTGLRRDLKELAFDPTHLPPVFVSIEACAYSGATLLSFLLGTHPRIATVGEMNGLIDREDPNTYLCSCSQRIRECQFWLAVTSLMHGKGFEFDVAHFDTKCELGGSWLISRLRRCSFRNNMLDSMRDTVLQCWPEEFQRIRKFIARNEAFVKAVLDVTAKEVFVDSSKDRWRVKYLKKFSAFDIRGVHLVRDVRGVVVSRLQRREDTSASKAASLWASENRRTERLVKLLPEDKRIRIRYEDLCLNVQGTLNKLFLFCGMAPTAAIDFLSVPHHIVGNKMRLQQTSEITLDERWKNILTKSQLKEIDGIAGALNRQYGYE